MDDRTSPSPEPRTAIVALGAGLLLLELLLALGGIAPPRPVPATAAPELFSSGRAVTVLEQLLQGVERHPVGSPENALVRERILHHLRRLGLEPEVQAAWSCAPRFSACAPVANVVATVPGREELDAVVLLAHYDSVHAGPGAADDGAGVAILLEGARALLAGHPTRRPVRLVISDGEEAGLLGARAFFADHPLAPLTFAVVNVEARGTTGPSLMFETSKHNRALVAAFARAVERPVASSVFVEAYRRLPNDTDLTVALEAGHPGLNFAFSEGVARYHTPVDDLAHLDPRSVQHQGESVLAAARELAGLDGLTLAGDAAYVDLFGRTLLHWPAGWSLPMALLALAGAAAAGISARPRIAQGAAGLLLGLLAWLAAIVAGGALAVACSKLVVAVAGDSAPWRADPLPLRAAVWAAVLLGSLAVATLVRRRVGLWSLIAGSWCGWSLVAAAFAVVAPGVAAAVLPSAVAAAAVLLFARIAGRRRPDLGAAPAAIGAALAGGSTGFALARLAEIGLGLGTAGVVLATVGLALVATSIAPLAAAWTFRRWALGGLAVVLVGASAVATLVSPADPGSPRHLNLSHLQAGGPEGPQWVARPGWGDAAALPEELAGMADFRPADGPPLPWWGSARSLRVAPAPTVEIEPPRLEAAGASPDGEGRVVRAQLLPGALPNLVLALPESSSPRALRVHGRDAGRGRRAGGYARWELTGVPAEPLEVEIELGSAVTVEAVLVGWGPGLPAAGSGLAAAKPPWAVPVGAGDLTAVVARAPL